VPFGEQNSRPLLVVRLPSASHGLAGPLHGAYSVHLELRMTKLPAHSQMV
jgi:hypothetical protein